MCTPFFNLRDIGLSFVQIVKFVGIDLSLLRVSDAYHSLLWFRTFFHWTADRRLTKTVVKTESGDDNFGSNSKPST